MNEARRPILDLGREQGRRIVPRWLIIPAFLAGCIAVLFLAAAYFECDRLLAIRTDIDACSGDLRRTHFVIYIKVSERVISTPFGNIVKERGLGEQQRSWQPVQLKSIVRLRPEGHYRFSPSVSLCDCAAKLYGLSDLPQEQKDTLMRKYLALLRGGNINGFAGSVQEDVDVWETKPPEPTPK